MKVPQTLEKHSRNIFLVFFCLVLALTLITALSVIRQTHLHIFDDAFISYRYAKNLAEHGMLSWNLTDPHTEGYSNFLLILILAIGIKLSIPPLILARIISFASLAVIGYSFCQSLWIKFKIAWKPALLLFILYVLSSQALELCMIGMETVLSAAFIALFIGLATRFQLTRTPTHQDRLWRQLCIVAILALLTRPENGLLIIPLLFLAGNSRPRFRLLLIYWLLPVTTYLLWKIYYYGNIFPLPFYLKAIATHTQHPLLFIQSSGIGAFVYTLSSHKLFFISAVLGTVLCWRSKIDRSWAIGLISIYLLFTLYLCTVDVLMNIYDRFFFPFLLIPFLLTAPLMTRPTPRTAAMNIAIYSLILLLALRPYRNEIFNTITNIPPAPDPKDLMTREQLFAQCLQQYPDINHLSIAFGDAGVTGYYTMAYFIDITGLNNNTIAKKSRTEAVNYLLDAKPALLIAPSLNDKWIGFGHGQLGDYNTWIRDPGLDNYIYVATVRTDAYDLQLLLQKDYPRFDELKDRLTHCSDTVYQHNGSLLFGQHSACSRPSAP